MSEKDVLRESESAAWNATGNVRLETCCVRRQPRHPHRNAREQPSNSTTKHYEIGGGHGSSHQRPSKPETRRAPYPGTVDYCLPNTREPQRLYQPTVESDSVRFRSLIYVNRKLSTSYHRQVRCNHPDMNAHWDIYSNRTPRPLSLKVSEIR